MIVTRGLGRGPNRGSIVGHGLTRRTRLERIIDAIEFFTLVPGRAMKTRTATMYAGIKALVTPNGSTE